MSEIASHDNYEFFLELLDDGINKKMDLYDKGNMIKEYCGDDCKVDSYFDLNIEDYQKAIFFFLSYMFKKSIDQKFKYEDEVIGLFEKFLEDVDEYILSGKEKELKEREMSGKFYENIFLISKTISSFLSDYYQVHKEVETDSDDDIDLGEAVDEVMKKL